METKDATIDDATIDLLAVELKSLAMLLPETVTGSTSTGRANQTKGPVKKETRTCHYCGKVGHLQKDCRKKKRDEASKASSSQSKPEGNVMSVSSSTLNQGHRLQNLARLRCYSSCCM
jgi:hypothetical protein